MKGKKGFVGVCRNVISKFTWKVGDRLPIEKKSEELLCDAAHVHASDIHFVPQREQGIIKYRVDGHLHTVEVVPYELFERLIAHFKFMAGMDIGERRKPQDGAMDVMVSGQLLHLRLSTLPAAFFESLVIRLLPQSDVVNFESLSLFPSSLQRLSPLLLRSSGLILFSGPTGSGKTTIMYSLLSQLQQSFSRQIVTLEDPVEKKVDLFLQMEINERAGLTYGSGFKSILRHDPDVIMIGEIRDEATAKLVIRAGLTGHLVFSTLHAEDSLGCLARLHEFGITTQELKQTLLGVVSQRLLSIVCPYCGACCDQLCYFRRKEKRAGIYELLTGPELEKGIDWIGGRQQRPMNFRSLNHYIRQGIACGYLSEDVMERWGVMRT
ncbi:competence protein comGA [Fictibacillus macauensis ZFHKF-1]|uniref:Competence protein comGA n=1 Tax=Fictibacillus macauensis ZFHKF-1 TaxID=1196324 RepID=I8AFV3_9BACL|nr:competence type IV pilus ATPase ComGA [Fictibacillus macauensis]EIT84487.1 competence protein comGA [Fictibacillus macauensis ZFHKF-1]